MTTLMARTTSATLTLAMALCAGCSKSTPPAETPEETSSSPSGDLDEPMDTMDTAEPGEPLETEPPDPEDSEAQAGAASSKGTQGHRHPGETRTTQVIADIIKKNRKQARACYEKAAKDVARLEGDVVIHFVLDPEGKVKSAELNEERSTIQLPALTGCVIDVIKSLPFPESSRGMETQVNYPFNFRP